MSKKLDIDIFNLEKWKKKYIWWLIALIIIVFHFLEKFGIFYYSHFLERLGLLSIFEFIEDLF